MANAFAGRVRVAGLVAVPTPAAVSASPTKATGANDHVPPFGRTADANRPEKLYVNDVVRRA